MKGNPGIKILLLIWTVLFSFMGVEIGSTFVWKQEHMGKQVKAAQIEQEDMSPVYDEKTESTVYSCIYFGSYPQTKMTGNSLTTAIENADYDENGDALVYGNKYHKVENIFGTSYFLYEPIKWKVIANIEGNIVAMAEKGLDYCSYYDAKESSEEENTVVEQLTDEELESYTDRREAYEETSWEESTIRSWLNSYGKKKNIANQSYKLYGQGFLSTAFSESEQSDLAETEEFSGFNLENYVTVLSGDRVFLLNSAGATYTKYGFLEKKSASPGRIVERTDYAIERGRERNDSFSEEGAWWISSESEEENKIPYVSQKGRLEDEGTESYHSLVVRPVIVIKEGSLNVKNAGKMSVSNEGGISISTQLHSDKYVSLNESKTRYKDATISIFVKNIGKEVVPSIDAELEFEDGTEILDGQNKVHFANIDVNAEKNIAWKFAVKPQNEARTAKYTIRITGENLGETYLENEIFIPELEEEIDDEILEEIEEERKANRTFLEKLRDFFKSFA